MEWLGMAAWETELRQKACWHIEQPLSIENQTTGLIPWEVWKPLELESLIIGNTQVQTVAIEDPLPTPPHPHTQINLLNDRKLDLYENLSSLRLIHSIKV